MKLGPRVELTEETKRRARRGQLASEVLLPALILCLALGLAFKTVLEIFYPCPEGVPHANPHP